MLREQMRVIDKSVVDALDTLGNEGWPERAVRVRIYDDVAVPRFIPHLVAGDHTLLG